METTQRETPRLDLETEIVVLPLAAVVRGLVNRPSLAQALGLPATHRVTLAQSVGQPGREA